MPNSVFYWPIRVYYEDTDAGGIVYNSNYLNFMERARTEWLRSLGIEQDVLRNRHHVGFVVSHIEVDFRRPARFNSSLRATVEIVKIGFASIVFAQKILNENDDELVSATVKIACVSEPELRPSAFPSEIKDMITNGTK